MPEWRRIPGFPFYEASDDGLIRRRGGTPRCPRARLLSQKVRKARPGRLPYREVALSHAGVVRMMLVHRLVALAFHGEPPTPDHEAAHDDGDVSNNTSGNLKWATVEQNKADYQRHGRTARDVSRRRRWADGRFAPDRPQP